MPGDKSREGWRGAELFESGVHRVCVLDELMLEQAGRAWLLLAAMCREGDVEGVQLHTMRRGSVVAA